MVSLAATAILGFGIGRLYTLLWPKHLHRVSAAMPLGPAVACMLQQRTNSTAAMCHPGQRILLVPTFINVSSTASDGRKQGRCAMLWLHWCVRREALRFRRAMEEAQEKLGQATDDNSKLKAQLEAASSDLADIEAFANKRCAWQRGYVLLVPMSGSC